jgi:hypothetical protein
MDSRFSGRAGEEPALADASWAALSGGVAAGVCGVPPAVVLGRNRADACQRARRLALHLSHVGLGVSMTRCAALFGRHRAAARRACARIEDGRERLAWDCALDRLERSLRIWRAAFSHVAGARQ